MNKTKKQQQTIDLDSDESTEAKLDLSVLRKPIITSVTGFDEMLRAYADGTSEVSLQNFSLKFSNLNFDRYKLLNFKIHLDSSNS
jgi:hypothetical protein